MDGISQVQVPTVCTLAPFNFRLFVGAGDNLSKKPILEEKRKEFKEKVGVMPVIEVLKCCFSYMYGWDNICACSLCVTNGQPTQ